MPGCGSSLSAVDQTQAAVLPGSCKHTTNLRAMLALLALVTVPVLALDQAIKFYVQAHMRLYQSIAVIPHWLDITYTRNPGAAFSLFVNLPGWFRTSFLFALSAVAIVVLLVLLARSADLNTNSISLALILAGAAGNLIDRATHGEVIDFIDAHYYTYHYPIFNIADCAITIGVALILAVPLFTRHRNQ